MEILFSFLSLTLLIGLLLAPVWLFVFVKKAGSIKFKFWTYLVLGLLLTTLLSWTLAWWGDATDGLLLRHYGYDPEAMNETGPFANVAEAHRKRVTQLETGYYGIGWTLQAVGLQVAAAVYLLVVYAFGQRWQRGVAGSQGQAASAFTYPTGGGT